ncbi:hypothetical protein P7C70_g9408, partial [Phenoliferia sp. Uapishka_3]
PSPSPEPPSSPGRGRNILHRLRIGSSGSSTNPPPQSQSQSQTSPLDFQDRLQREYNESPARIPFNRSRNSSVSTDLNGGQPFSPAASFLSSFSPPGYHQHARSGSGASFASFGALNNYPQGDEQGFRIAGYILGRELGAGGFGVVREATLDLLSSSTMDLDQSNQRDHQKIAVKIVRHSGMSNAGVEEKNLGEALRRSVSQLRAGGAGRRILGGSGGERSRSSSSPMQPIISGAALEGGGLSQSASNERMARTLSSQMRDLSSSLSSLPAPFPKEEEDTEPTLLRTLLEREISLWQQLAPHPHIMPLLSVHHSTEFSYIFMPLCEGGNLLSYLTDYHSSKRPISNDSNGSPTKKKKPRSRPSIPIAPISPSPSSTSGFSSFETPTPKGLPFATVREIFGQVASGLSYLHNEARVTHKDVKLENILLDEAGVGGTWKIADFGLAETSASAAGQSATNSRSTSRRRTMGGSLAVDEEDDDRPIRGHFLSASDRGPITPGTPLSSLSRAGSLSRPDEAIQEHLHPAGSLPYSPPEQ